TDQMMSPHTSRPTHAAAIHAPCHRFRTWVARSLAGAGKPRRDQFPPPWPAQPLSETSATPASDATLAHRPARRGIRSSGFDLTGRLSPWDPSVANGPGAPAYGVERLCRDRPYSAARERW